MVVLTASPSERELRAAFDAAAPLTLGIEEELMVLDAGTLDLAPRTGELLAAAGDDPRFKPELPAAQVEIVLAPVASAGEVASALGAARGDLARVADRVGLRLAGAGAHPFAAPEGELSDGDRYAFIRREYGRVAARQLVFALQVHVALGGAERSLAVYNALREWLPELAALAANAPFHAGADTGLASVRPTISGTLPRQGVPPVLASWGEYADALRRIAEPRLWWWELRPHPAYGTLEVRVPDTQATVADAVAVTAAVHSLVAWLGERADGDDLPPPAPTWRIEENRWSACRHGLAGAMTDVHTGEHEPTRDRIGRLLDTLVATAERMGAAAELADARRLLAAGGAERQRAAAHAGGPRAAASWLAERFLGA
jgi:glutamate---cysteine ligase / carboxylate-amine ligase